MADIAPVLLDQRYDRVRTYLWEQINQDDQGAAVQIMPEYHHKCFHAQGTFDGGEYSLNCSMDDVTFVPAVDFNGDPVALSQAGSVRVASIAPYWAVANDGNGTTEDVDAFLVCILG